MLRRSRNVLEFGNRCPRTREQTSARMKGSVDSRCRLLREWLYTRKRIRCSALQRYNGRKNRCILTRYAVFNFSISTSSKKQWSGHFPAHDFVAKENDSAIRRDSYGVNSSMPAKIYRPAKTAMQSGKAKTHLWVLEYDQEKARVIDSVTAYTGSGDMRQQLKLTFETRELAEAYAQREGIEYRVIEPKDATRKAVSYTDNFRFTRTQPWTH